MGRLLLVVRMDKFLGLPITYVPGLPKSTGCPQDIYIFTGPSRPGENQTRFLKVHAVNASDPTAVGIKDGRHAERAA